MKDTTLRFIILGAILLGLAGFFILRSSDAPSPEGEALRQASEFILQDYMGHEVTLSDFRGKPVIVNAWASWCPFCREELKDFVALQQEFSGKISIIAIDRGEPFEVAARYSDALGVTPYLVFLLDPNDSFYQSIGGFSMPETIFVDADGFIRDHKRGPMPLEEIRRRSERMLEL